jgi:hypothetical protein
MDSESSTAPALSIISPDWLLEELVSYVNHEGLQVGISLNVPGAIMSGTLISVTQYFDEFAAQFEAGLAANPEQAKIFFDRFSSFKPTEEELSKHRPIPQFIHLKDAKLHSPGATRKSVIVPLWRGRINEVAGFFLGVFSD